MKRIPLANKAVAIPLIGLLVAWVCFMAADLANLYVPQPIWDSMGNQVNPNEVFHFAPYLFLLGISAGAVASLIGQGWAIRARKELGDEHKLARAAQRFTTLGIILGLAAGAIFAIGNFMGAFNSYSGRAEDVTLRILNVYVPILLATAMVIYVLLAAFVFRHDEPKSADGEKSKMSEAQRALGLGYAIPILATAIAIILGLAVYDVTKTDLQVWVWVVIIAIVAIGVVLGTRFANRAKQIKPAPAKPRTALAAGAANLNFVLSIVFGAAVSFMAFTFGSAAIYKLQIWRSVAPDCVGANCDGYVISAPTWNWFFEEMFPAKVLLLLAVVGIYVTITERNKEAKK